MRGRNLLLFTLCVYKVYGEDSTEDTYPSYEYVQIFKGVPALFEYLLSAIEEKPEILEKNDVSIFNTTIHKTNNEEVDKRSIQQNTEDCCESEKQKRNIDPIFMEIKGPLRFKAEEYVSRILINNIEDDCCQINAKRETVTEDIKTERLNDRKLKDEVGKQNDKTDSSAVAINGGAGWQKDDEYISIPNLFRLDVQPEEILENMILTEKLLEDYNYNKNKAK